ncbi:MAG: hypothetical protein NTZ90_07100 [Proteobacteria bacterium]|nr:hypothetical protein [Pseudomonadota bacterium]
MDVNKGLYQQPRQPKAAGSSMSTNDQDQADDILNQLNSDPAATAEMEEPTLAESTEPAPIDENRPGSSHDTAEMPINQAKGLPPSELSLRQKVDQRLAVIQAQLSEKEQLQLCYVYQKVPKPYYWRWKAEGNQVFSLTVGLKLRRRKMG